MASPDHEDRTHLDRSPGGGPVFAATGSRRLSTLDRGARAAAMVLLVAGAAGCGSASKPPTAGATTTHAVAASTGASKGGNPASATKDACSLLSSAEVQAAVGGTVGPGGLTTAPGTTETICTWTITPTSGNTFGAELDVVEGASDADFTQQRQAASAPTSDVPGLGDEAYSERAEAGGQIFDDLWVHKATTSFRLEVLGDLGTGPLIALARAVIGGL